MSTQTLSLADTTIGKKMVMAVSGLALFGFLIGHMLGNLQVFVGRDAMNAYAAALHSMMPLLWAARMGLLLAVVAHVVMAVQLTRRNRAARPTAYRMHKSQTTSLAAKTMIYGGLALVLYIGYHLAHLTFGVTAGLGYQHLPLDPNGLPDVYHNVIQSFRVPWCAAIYVVANLLLGLHLYHGIGSMAQSLGFSHKRYDAAFRSVMTAFAMVIVAGFIAVPVGVYVGFVG